MLILPFAFEAKLTLTTTLLEVPYLFFCSPDSGVTRYHGSVSGGLANGEPRIYLFGLSPYS
jgi:hypothetical protein